MKNYRNLKSIRLLFVLLAITIISLGFMGDDKTGTKNIHKHNVLNKTNTSGKQGDAYVMKINNVTLPLNSRGIIADVNVGDELAGGRFAGNIFLFSGGFFLTGYSNGALWGSAAASASLIENYIPGLAVPDGENDPRAQIYVLNNEDEPFGDSWEDWKDAVELGADYYDGDGSGTYNPMDLNGNGSWDPNEDSPDLLGDETVWCVYNDGQPLAQRSRFAGIRPQGIEIRQTVFGFASAGAIGNITFIRYRIKNTGTIADTLKDVIFGAWADPDLGDHTDDLVGVDTTKNAAFTYQTTSDQQYGPNPPAFVIDFFSGPISYDPGITFEDANGNGAYDEGETTLDTAYSIRGQRIGVVEYPGARNLGVSSFVHYQQSDPDLGDPNTHIEARHYMEGLDKQGEVPDPCDWALGEVVGGVDCAEVDPRFWYSGDPVARVGWLNNAPTDQRQMQNTGPFELIKDVELEIVVAYVVGQGSDPLSSVTQALIIDEGAQFIFDQNFQSPSPGPRIVPVVETGEDFIDLVWETKPQTTFINESEAYELRFEGYNIFAFKTNTTQEEVALQQNKTTLASFDMEDYVENVFLEVGPGDFELVYPFNEDNQLDSAVYTSEDGIIRYRIRRDPFTNANLVKGKPYYFAVTGYYLNWDAMRYRSSPVPDSLGVPGDYFLSQESLVGVSENIPKITTAILGENLYDPPMDVKSANQDAGFSSGEVTFDVYNKDELLGNDYEVTFFSDDEAANFSSFWRLTNVTTNTVLLDSVDQYLYGNEQIAIPELQTEGFITKVRREVPRLSSMVFEEEQPWLDRDFTIYYYVSDDIPASQRPTVENVPTLDMPSIQPGNYVDGDEIRRVEIRFDEGSKAYRYLNGFVKSSFLPASRIFTYVYAEEIDEADTSLGGSIGKFGEGFVDVPFSAWVEDDVYGERRQLAVGFIENSSKDGGNPDGVWDPGTSLSDSKEYIVIFNETYDPTGSNIIYKGGSFIGSDVPRADLRGEQSGGYVIPPEVPISEEQRAIAKSPYFNALYVLGVQRINEVDFYSSSDRIIIPVSNYPYTEADVFSFSTVEDGLLSDDQERALWDKVNVYPNPLFGYNVATSYNNSAADDPFVTFSNLPEEITIKIHTLSGIRVRTLTTDDKASPTSPFLRWDLQNESGLRVASGMYIALISSPKFGDKVLKFAIIMPQKQIPKF